MSGGCLSLVPGSGCLSCVMREWGQHAHLCLSRSGRSVLISPLRMKARRKQAARRLKGMDDEDTVMGTVALVSDVGVFSCSVNVHSTSPDSCSAFPQSHSSVVSWAGSWEVTFFGFLPFISRSQRSALCPTPADH